MQNAPIDPFSVETIQIGTGKRHPDFGHGEKKTPLFEKAISAFYPSDQINFKTTFAVASLKKKPVFGYYMDKIHTPKDTVCEEENLRYLCEGFVKFTKKI